MKKRINPALAGSVAMLFLVLTLGCSTGLNVLPNKSSALPSTSAIFDSLTGMEFVQVKGGCFQMGDSFGDGSIREQPVHEVCVSDFAIGKYEVTQDQWRKVMKPVNGFMVTEEQWRQMLRANPSYFSRCGNNCPVENISLEEIHEFIRRLNDGKAGNKYRLPTEAEWEYACRSGGRIEKYCGGNNLESVAWHVGNSGYTVHQVGTKEPNALGIYDMSGNVSEWVGDGYESYNSEKQNNPTGATSGTRIRMIRGGSWGDNDSKVRASARDMDTGFRSNTRGGRLVIRLVP